jgi:two-component system response regulator HydG
MPRVLVVDDEKGFRAAIAHRLRREGYEVDAAGGEAEGLARIAGAAHSYDVVVADLAMEQPRSGINVLEAALCRDLLTEVIALTNYGSGEVAAACVERGASDYVEKYFPGLDLCEVIALKTHQAVQRRRFALQTLQRFRERARHETGEMPVGREQAEVRR